MLMHSDQIKKKHEYILDKHSMTEKMTSPVKPKCMSVQ